MPIAEVNGQTLYYEVHGEGEPLLCVMGLAADTLAWTLQRPAFAARHRTVIFDNRSYAILSLELLRVGARTDGNAADLFDLSRPPLDFVSLARGMGVDGTRAETADELVRALEQALSEPGPHLIDAVIPPLF